MAQLLQEGSLPLQKKQIAILGKSQHFKKKSGHKNVSLVFKKPKLFFVCEMFTIYMDIIFETKNKSGQLGLIINARNEKQSPELTGTPETILVLKSSLKSLRWLRHT